jgi:hypothetical protein
LSVGVRILDCDHRDQIQEYVKKAYIDPARKVKLSKVTFSSAKIHDDLKLKAHYAGVCDAIEAKKFHDENMITLTARTGPKLGRNVRWTFSL